MLVGVCFVMYWLLLCLLCFRVVYFVFEFMFDIIDCLCDFVDDDVDVVICFGIGCYCDVGV